MTIEEIAHTLRNGFHDAEVSSILINYAVGEMVLNMDIWIGDLDSPDCETYRRATLTLSGLIYCVIEPPETSLRDLDAEPLTVDTGTVDSLLKPPTTKLPSETMENVFTNWFYVREWNACLYVSAKGANLVWEGESVDRG